MSKFPFHKRRYLVALVLGVAVLAMPTLTASLTNRIVMPPTVATLSQHQVTPDALKPSQCDMGLSELTELITGTGTANGTPGHDLILGTPGDDTLNGGDGDDCLVGGAGTDTFDGGPGDDICVGNADSVFISCEIEIRN